MAALARLLAAWVLLAAGTAAAQPAQLLFYEAVPAVEARGLDSAPFGTRMALTRRVQAELVPGLLDLAGVAAGEARTEVTVGGWKLRTNPSLHTGVPLADAAADRLAAAFGFVLGQESVLVADLVEGDGGTGYALVRFPEGALTPAEAQRFFEHAAGVAEGLGGGYTAFGDAMLFLNVRGAAGPYSGLEDEAFVAALRRAAETFQGPRATVAEIGRANARFVENDWSRKPGGEGYAALLGAELAARLGDLRSRHAEMVRAAAGR